VIDNATFAPVRVVQGLTLGIPTHVTQSWAIKPTTCLIPWNLIAYAKNRSGFFTVTHRPDGGLIK
jgi:hypothetical protein